METKTIEQLLDEKSAIEINGSKFYAKGVVISLTKHAKKQTAQLQKENERLKTILRYISRIENPTEMKDVALNALK